MSNGNALPAILPGCNHLQLRSGVTVSRRLKFAAAFCNPGRLVALAILLFNMVGSCTVSYGQPGIPFTHTALTETGDLSAKMVLGINDFLVAETWRQKDKRPERWTRDFSSTESFNRSIAAQRELLALRLGVAEKRLDPELQGLSSGLKQLSLASEGCTIYAVKWQSIEGLPAEGLLITPKATPISRVVMIPDADTPPEVFAGMQQPAAPGFGTGLQLAKAGFEVLIPALVNRDTSFSGNAEMNEFTRLPHREWIYRQAYALGRHVIGYELQKIFAAIDWFAARNKAEGTNGSIGVAGHGEGALLALYAAVLDQRISSTLVSGYFDAREQLWKKPIYRNVFGLLKTFGDAELAVMVWPRALVIEQAQGPEIVHNNENVTPGIITTPSLATAQAEFMRAKSMLPAGKEHLQFIADKSNAKPKPFSANAMASFAAGLGVSNAFKYVALNQPIKTGGWIDDHKRQQRIVQEMGDQVQHVLAICERTRNTDFWSKLQGDSTAQKPVLEQERKRFWEVLGRLPTPSVPFNARARIFQESEKWTSYEVTLDVFNPDVYAWGILVVPKGIKEGEKRPVVVCQHGLEGLPFDLVTTDTAAENYHYYKGLATRLAEKGYITFAPHNPYRGGDEFRVIQRKGNPLGLTLFSVIISQHQRIVEWLKQLSFVDPARIGFYGLSYGGKTAMRVPAVVEGYALSICSADFNEWVRKVATTSYSFGYVYTGEYDMPEWDLGHTFNYAEMAALISPRPFMVERGHFDGVGKDEWVNFEFAKVRQHYDLMGLEKRARIEHFVGPHSINGVGTFEFLDEYLKPQNH